jgi:hypothetical protein
MYARMASAPFANDSSAPHRILGPLLAHLLHIDGDRYWVFSHATVVALLAVLLGAAVRRGCSLTAAAVLTLTVSLTQAMALYKGIVGYPDPMSFLLLVLVLHVAFGDFHEVGDEIVPSLELHFDLGEGVLVAVLERYQLIEDADDPRAEDDGNEDEHDQQDQSRGHREPPVDVRQARRSPGSPTPVRPSCHRKLAATREGSHSHAGMVARQMVMTTFP